MPNKPVLNQVFEGIGVQGFTNLHTHANMLYECLVARKYVPRFSTKIPVYVNKSLLTGSNTQRIAVFRLKNATKCLFYTKSYTPSLSIKYLVTLHTILFVNSVPHIVVMGTL